MITIEGIPFNVELILTCVSIPIISWFFTRNWIDPRRLKIFYSLLFPAYALLFKVLMPLVFVMIERYIR